MVNKAAEFHQCDAKWVNRCNIGPTSMVLGLCDMGPLQRSDRSCPNPARTRRDLCELRQEEENARDIQPVGGKAAAEAKLAKT